jgi:putative hemolysin
MLGKLRRRESLFPELSYASEGQAPLKRWFIKSVEGLSGRERYARLYDIWRREIAPSRNNIFTRMLGLIDVGLDVDGAWPPANLPDSPLVIVANHPFGIGDGIAALSLAERLGRPFRVMIHKDLLKIPDMVPYSLAIDFGETKEALKNNLAVRAEALKLLKEGVTIVVFRGGWRGDGAARFRQGQGLAVEDVPCAPDPGGEGGSHPGAFLRPERASFPSGQRSDESRPRGRSACASCCKTVADGAHLAADTGVCKTVG